MTTFTREIKIHPAYDCLTVQPCVHGSETCGNVPGAGHGRHNAEMHMILHGDNADAILYIGTNWYRPETPLYVQKPEYNSTHFVEFHSTEPQYEGHAPLGGGAAKCPRGWGTCYIDQTYSGADEGWSLLVSKGSDAAWEWLEQFWQDKFGGAS